MKTIDLYCRISRDYDGTLRSVESQADDLTWAIKDDHDGWAIGQVFQDHAISAWDRQKVRPEFEAMMARLESGLSDGVMVYDLTRFTRKPEEGERLLALASRGIIVASLSTTYNLQTADGRLQFRNAMSQAAFESDKISERSTRGKKNKARRGVANNSHRGFARDGYLPNGADWQPGDPRTRVPADRLAREQEAVRTLVEGLLAGTASFSETARAWNDAGLLTINGKRWDGVTIRQALTRPAMAGLIEHKGIIVGQIEDAERVAPLDRETWERLMLHLSSRKRGRSFTKYTLSGILRCGKCGGMLFGRPLSARPPYADGSVKRQYWCQVRVKENAGCGGLCIDWKLADAEVERMVKDRLADPQYATAIAQATERVAAAQRSIQVEIDALVKERDALADKVGEPGWTVDAVTKNLAKFAALIDAAVVRRDALGDTPTTPKDRRKASRASAETQWAEAVAAGVPAVRQLITSTLVEGLVVEPAESRGVGVQAEQRIKLGTYPVGTQVA